MPIRTKLGALGLAVLCALAVLTTQSPTSRAATSLAATSPSSTSASQAKRVVAIAEAQVGKPYRFGAMGPRAFDCSGLVLYVFRRAGVGGRIGGGHNSFGMYRWFRARGLASRSNPRVGDLVIYNGGAHVGIYIGRGRVISALLSGVRIHALSAFRGRFAAYLHTRLR